ncbi:hypothetical protein RJ639_023852 [Escallonia herrerae]|uniref:DC1 domain-containing protein n=1 Tax=Escallonia herrerae TaxID=1293975 RepID=A0AA89ADY9_9ASTE|nr:hypothetical protein RJ639_023852 [Escallonia herrerae]
MESESKHFSHEHELTLHEVQQLDDGETERAACYACLEQIAEQAFFTCGDCDDFFLHQTCANLSKEIEGPVHPQHPLILLANRSCYCDVCGRDWKRFTYNCAPCDFDVCIACAWVGKIKNLGHDHPLVPYNQVKENDTGGEEVVCGGCNKPITEDDAYSCSDCDFFLHKTCAELPEALLLAAGSVISSFTKHVTYPIKLSTFLTPNTLLPSYFDKIRLLVSFFARAVETFGCGSSTIVSSVNLRYVYHVLCCPLTDLQESKNKSCMIILFTSSLDHQILIQTAVVPAAERGQSCYSTDLKSTSSEQNEIKVGESDEVMKFPVPDEFMNQINYFLQLPDEVQHPCHPQHPLSFHPKSSAESLSIFLCDLCNRRCNGFRYRCELCNFDLDLRCASVPDTIVHEAHRHPLVPATSGIHCSACKEYCDLVTYGCDTCGFYLEAFCAMYPRTATHYYDAHTLSLVYPPFPDHPDEFYCEMCQDEIAPNLWLYHCHDCNQSFHPRCLLPAKKNLSFKKKTTTTKMNKTWKREIDYLNADFLNGRLRFVAVRWRVAVRRPPCADSRAVLRWSVKTGDAERREPAESGKP